MLVIMTKDWYGNVKLACSKEHLCTDPSNVAEEPVEYEFCKAGSEM